MRLNMGCGWEKFNGFINIDKAKEVKPDQVINIEKGLPFKNNYFKEIYSKHCLEHIKPEKWGFVLNEIARVAKNNCLLVLDLPFDSIRTRGHIDHYRTFNYGSFDQLICGKSRNYYSKLRLKPLRKVSIIKKLFFYIFPLLKFNIHYEFLIKKGF